MKVKVNVFKNKREDMEDPHTIATEKAREKTLPN